MAKKGTMNEASERYQAIPLVLIFLIMSMHLLIMTAVIRTTTRTMTIMRIAMMTIEATIPTRVDKSLVNHIC